MGRDNRQIAYEQLIALSERQGYVTFDNIMDCADEHALPIQDFDWLSNSITTRGILVYSEAPSHQTPMEEDEYDDYAQSDYEAVYNRIIELSPSLENLVSYVKAVLPPQRGEIKQLKYQIVDGNLYARERMIEMHLRLALRVALQRAELYDMDIEDAIGYACIGLVVAVDKYDPDTSGAFTSYAALWILQNISREQSTKRCLIYYPVHKKEAYFSLYPLLKNRGCIGCDELSNCKNAVKLVCKNNNCSEESAKEIIQMMIPDERIEDLAGLHLCNMEECSGSYISATDIMEDKFRRTIVSEEDMFSDINCEMRLISIEEALDNLSPREKKVLELRYGIIDGRERTLEQVGCEFNVTRERIRQIESKALRKLRHPKISRKLRDYT